MQNTPDDELLNEIETATDLKVAVPTLRRWRWEGKHLSFLKLGGLVRYQRSEINRFKQASLRTSTSDGPGHA